jgi:hypothetical protein
MQEHTAYSEDDIRAIFMSVCSDKTMAVVFAKKVGKIPLLKYFVTESDMRYFLRDYGEEASANFP